MPSIALIKQLAKQTTGGGLSDGGTECQQQEQDGRMRGRGRGAEGGLRAAANCLLCVLLTIRFWPNNFVPNTKVSRKCYHTPHPLPRRTALPFTPATVNRSANVDCDCDGDCDYDYDCERAAN